MEGETREPATRVPQEQLLAIATDGDLDPTTKTFAFCLLAWLTLPAEERRRRSGGAAGDQGRAGWVPNVGEMMLGNTPPTRLPGGTDHPTRLYHAIKAVRRAVAHDAPRYEPPLPGDITCAHNIGAPRTPRLCRQPAVTARLRRDPQTGEGTYLGVCDNHNTAENREQAEQEQRRWIANGRPTPPANAGGVLSRYFEADWTYLYQWAAASDRDSAPPPPEVPTRPALSIVKGGCA